MRVVVACDSFGGWRSAADVGRAVAGALRAAGHEARVVPVGDGGEGTVSALAAVPLPTVAARCTGPLGEPRAARLAIAPGPVVVVESAHAVGPPSPETRARWGSTSSAGLAALLHQGAAEARSRGARLAVGLGGSATVDSGRGLARALGLRIDRDGVTGPAPVLGVPVVAWADVHAPLAGAAAFAPQKGLPAAAVAALPGALLAWAAAVNAWRRDQGRAPVPVDGPGTGAAGGLGFALTALLDAPRVDGAAAVLDAVGLDASLAWAEAVVTGEGRLDETSLQGKIIGAVVDRARALGVPVHALVGEARFRPDTLASIEEVGGMDDARLRAAAARVATRLGRPA